MSDLWVFGYGSLMWRPGFPYCEAIPARLNGEHRALCIFSFVHRGTRDKPGLVLGLDRGGSCRGVAFRVQAADAEATRAYLRERELVTNVYREVERPVRLETDGGGSVRALAYVTDRRHEQYAGRLDPAAVLAHIRDAEGISGRNRDYVIATMRHLEAVGVHDPLLLWLSERLETEP
jgi:glutathione-specific gamma-glutamylcyclotransferase